MESCPSQSVEVVDGANSASDEEVVDACSLFGLTGARVRVHGHETTRTGSVRAVSPSGTRMLICCEMDSTELWVSASDSWDLDSAPAEQPAHLVTPTDSAGAPTSTSTLSMHAAD